MNIQRCELTRFLGACRIPRDRDMLRRDFETERNKVLTMADYPNADFYEPLEFVDIHSECRRERCSNSTMKTH